MGQGWRGPGADGRDVQRLVFPASRPLGGRASIRAAFSAGQSHSIDHLPPRFADLIMKSSWVVTALALWAGILFGEVPVKFEETVLSPGKTRQGTAEGMAVATDGVRIVTGAVGATFRNYGEGVANVYDAVTGELLITLKNPNYHVDGFGGAVCISGSLVVVGSSQESTGAFQAGSAYVFDLASPTPGTPIAVLHNPRPQMEAHFGESVAISGHLVVVGARDHDESLTNSSSGIVYVYDLASETPEHPRFVLENSSPGFAAFFGDTVAVSGNRVAVSAPYNDRGTSRTGSVYLYELDGAAPATPSRVLKHPEAVESAAFGYSMALSSGRLAVGVIYDEPWVPRSGTAYVYDLNGVSPEIPLFAAEGAKDGSDMFFAYSVAISETRMVAGSLSGPACTIYDLTSPSPVPIATISRPAGNAGHHFGIATAVSGNQVVIGAPSYDLGSAFVYDGIASDSPIAPRMILNAGLPSLDDNFGSAVAMSDQYMVVGAAKENAGAQNSGAAYIIPLANGGEEKRTITLTNPTPGTRDNFGHAVAISGFNVVVGCAYDDAGASSAGVVYIYDIASDAPGIPVLTLHNPRPHIGDNFGYAVAVDGPYVVVGTPNEDAVFKDDGVAYVYDLRSATPAVPVAILRSQSAAVGDNFGTSVAISGTRVVAGVNCADRGAANSGAAYVFDLDSDDPAKPVLEITNPDPVESDNFGWVVAIEGDLIAVSARFDETNLANAGSVYVYDISGGTAGNLIAVFSNPVPDYNVRFGSSIALSQGKLLIGAPEFGIDFLTPGRAYLYEVTRQGSGALLASIENPTPDHFDLFGAAVAIKGASIAIGSYSDDTPTFDRGVVHLYTTQDVATDAPHLIRPHSYTSTRNSLGVAFTLFEPAAEGSVKVTLRMGEQEWSVTLGAAYEHAGTHNLLINLSNPLATPGVTAATGGAIPDGSYDVTISYSDLQRHPSASAIATGVVIDNVAPIVGPVRISANNQRTSWARTGTTVTLSISVSEAIKAPTVTLAGAAVSATGGPTVWTASMPVSSGVPEGPISFSIVCEDLAGNVAEPVTATSDGTKVTVDHTPPVVQAPEVVRTVAVGVSGAVTDFEVSATDNLDPVVRLNLSHRSGASFPLGLTTVTARAEDAAGHTASVQFDVIVRLENAVKTAVFAKGESVPNPGDPLSRVPAGARWASFGVPSLLGATGYDAVTGFAARISTPAGLLSGIFSGPVATPVARLLVGDAATDNAGQALAGATFKSFRDPVFASPEDFAVIARLQGPAVKPSTSDGIWAGDATGVFEVARKGSPAPGIDGASFASFSSVLMPTSDRVYFLALLQGGGVMRANDSSLWHWSRETGAQLVQREGNTSSDGSVGDVVKSFLALQTVNDSAGHGRYDEQLVAGLFTRADKSQVVVTFDGSGTAATDLESGVEPMPGLTITSLGFPSLLSEALGLSVRAILDSPEGSGPAVLRDGTVVARKGALAPGAPDAIFEDFADPVTGLAPSGTRADVFLGRISGPQVRKSNDQGIWIYQGDAPALNLLAREGSEAVGCNGAVFKSFLSVTLIKGRGPLFTATVSGGSPRVKAGTDTGLWATDLDGALRLLLREGEDIGGRTLKHFDVLEVVPGSPAQQRAWTKAALDHVVMRCFFTDGSQAIVQLVIP